MRTGLLLLLLAITLAASLGATCTGLRIVMIGDSNTAGVCAPGESCTPYRTVMQQQLTGGWQVLNRGFSGTGVATDLPLPGGGGQWFVWNCPFVELFIDQADPDGDGESDFFPAGTAQVMLGSNDVNRGISAGEWRQRMSDLIDCLLELEPAPGRAVGVILHTPPPMYANAPAGWAETLAGFAQEARNLCQGGHPAFPERLRCGVDAHSELQPGLHVPANDPHLTTAGHQLMGELAAARFLEILDEDPALRIGMIGDSNTAGVECLPPCVKFSDVLQEELSQPWNVVSRGVAGSGLSDPLWVTWDCTQVDASFGADQDGDGEADGLPGGTAHVMLGYNDTPHLAPAAWGQRLSDLVDCLLAPGRFEQVLVTTPPPPEANAGVNRLLQVHSLAEEVRALTAGGHPEAGQRLFLGVDAFLELQQGVHVPDHTAHLSAAGHQRLGELLAARFLEVVRDR